ncbi:dnaJ homolog subfamily A member 3, mitochondrial [Eupeodes corollae]|uniref:dnaJ homolog subfamily A member 3, mitochondrial n=1 Tax=Eupeodes corollae TaxID=290404 RepID=UPI00248F4742|nr:dnaJ homolog subfamily A member 3, mitochondrial [Eupeodes corollae]
MIFMSFVYFYFIKYYVKMLKIVKLSQNLTNHCFFVRSTSSWQHQFKIEKPIYYPKRSLSKEDESQIPTQVTQISQGKLVNEVGLNQTALDLYEILGVEKNASVQLIKAAYYDLAKKYHPDAKPTPKETQTFRRISEAYRILSDQKTRFEYDQKGVVTLEAKKPTSFLEENKKNFQRFLRELPRTINMEQRRASLFGSPRKPVKTEIELKIKFNQAIHGSTEYVDLKSKAKCNRCNGVTQICNQNNMEFCPKCGGTGQYRDKKANMAEKKCDMCDGRRFINKNSCKTCDNRGYVVQNKRVEIHVPEGTSDGDMLKINHPITKEDVFIKVSVEKSNYFNRDGNNIATDKYLTISHALLGGKCKIRGLYEDFEVNLGPGVESHTVHCFKRKGIRTKAGVLGDHFVTFKIRMPKTLTTKQRQLMLAFSKAEDPIIDGQVA